jgi:hypothetical protein
MYLQQIIEDAFTDLEGVLLQLSNEQYTAKSTHLFNATIGQHVRHIIELFQCLVNGYETGVANYDKRKRDITIENDTTTALLVMRDILYGINKAPKPLMVEASFGMPNETIIIESNFTRELVYNLEHTIHHMALIRVGINELTDIVVSEKFGVAPSTIQHRAVCAQ